ncbi:hypothetical protein ACRAWD_00780 [Caulobacter segnis]
MGSGDRRHVEAHAAHHNGYGRNRWAVTESNGGLSGANVTITNRVFDNRYGLAAGDDGRGPHRGHRHQQYHHARPALPAPVPAPAAGCAGRPARRSASYGGWRSRTSSASAKPWLLDHRRGGRPSGRGHQDQRRLLPSAGRRFRLELARRDPPEADKAYPDPDMLGDLPANGFFIRRPPATSR